MFRSISFFVLLLCMGSCVTYQPLVDTSPAAISRNVKKGDNVRLTTGSGEKVQEVDQMAVSAVEGDSVLWGVVKSTGYPDKPMRIRLSEITEIGKFKFPPSRETSFVMGYNSFNEVYAGVRAPKNSLTKAVLELGYQFALSKSATYSQVINPILTTNAHGLRARLGYQFPMESSRFGVAYFEYQNLQSNEFYFYESAHSGSYQAYFTESYTKYGIRCLAGIPIMKSSNVYFTYSVAVFYMLINRQYSRERPAGGGWHPSDRVEISDRATAQMTVGIRFHVF